MASQRDTTEHPFGDAVANLVDQFAKLPGIGKKSAERLAYHVLNVSPIEASGLADAIMEVKKAVRRCDVCLNLTDTPVCKLCSDSRRDRTRVCVVEQPKDVAVLEAAGAFDGTYHVLGGRLNPLEGIGPDDLSIAALVNRVKADGVSELVMATNPTLEGDGTALYIANLIQGITVADGTGHEKPVQITRLARGIATGSVLEFANKEMLADAFTGPPDVLTLTWQFSDANTGGCPTSDAKRTSS